MYKFIAVVFQQQSIVNYSGSRTVPYFIALLALHITSLIPRYAVHSVLSAGVVLTKTKFTQMPYVNYPSACYCKNFRVLTCFGYLLLMLLSSVFTYE